MSNKNQIYHSWEFWECYKNGFYDKNPHKITEEKAILLYNLFFENLSLFDKNIFLVFSNWKKSCEHFMTNKSFNRIAWLGQASIFYHFKVPRKYKNVFYHLDKRIQIKANKLAKKRIVEWENKNIKKNNNLLGYLNEK